MVPLSSAGAICVTCLTAAMIAPCHSSAFGVGFRVVVFSLVFRLAFARTTCLTAALIAPCHSSALGCMVYGLELRVEG